MTAGSNGAANGMNGHKTVCIVGVAGFIGSHLLEKIIREKDWHVVGIDMVAPSKIQQLLGAEKKWAARFEFHQARPARTPASLHALRLSPPPPAASSEQSNAPPLPPLRALRPTFSVPLVRSATETRKCVRRWTSRPRRG